jgi:transglutaminase-like putative cysteine protease
MNRRNTLQLMTAAALSLHAHARASESNAKFVSPTRYIDSEHPRIKALVQDIAPPSHAPRQRAMRIHDYVRDQIKFGWASDFYDQRASEVLNSGIGFCNTKSTLFTAMLRAANIPARQHFVDIDAKILAPFLDPGMPYVDHSFVEVYLDDRWISTDSYIVDRPLFVAALPELQRRSLTVGFGIHRDAKIEWDGTSDSFSQFVRSAAYPSLTTRDYGVHDDIAAFYASGNGVNKANFFVKLGFGLFVRSANQRIEALRGGSERRAS